ncbi:Cation-transporting P-type ATPase [Theobroma cacao]|nr:Cation-transporting P-type ATPase [Theobroma cacao]
MGIIGITILLQVVMVEFLKKFADTERLNWGQWGACIGIAVVSWPIGWVVKSIPVPEKPFFSYLEWRNIPICAADRENSFYINKEIIPFFQLRTVSNLVLLLKDNLIVTTWCNFMVLVFPLNPFLAGLGSLCFTYSVSAFS